MLGQPPLAVLPPGKISYTCRIAPHIIINYRLLTYWGVTLVTTRHAVFTTVLPVIGAFRSFAITYISDY
jgi:hypothetical protein